MLKRILFFISALWLINGSLSAQITSSNISGSVKESKGEILAGATVTATHLPSGTVYTTITTKTGDFFLQNCRIGGPYQVKIDFVNMQSAIFDNITLQLGETFNINAVLNSEAQVLENVIVSTRARKAATDKTGATTNISNREINTLPTISRSITDFTKLTPQANGNSFAGRDGRYNNIQVDGANLNNNFGLSSDPLPGGNSQPISLDAFEEISVNIAPYDVRQGNFTGAGINAVTRSGDNTYKGSAFGFYRDESFNGKKVDNQKLPPLAETKNYVYGARVGGPIIKNKLFFFLNFELEDRTFPGIPWRPSQPGLTGTNVSATHVDSLKKFSDFLKSTYNYDTGPYDNFPNFGISNNKFLGRIDWNISKNHKLIAKYSDMVGEEDQQLNGTSIPNGGVSGLTRLTNNRFGNNSMAFANSNYRFQNTVRSGTLEINSRLGKRANNQLLGTYTYINTTRVFDGGVFPTIDILNQPAQPNFNYMHAGMDPFTYNNDVINKIWSVIDNFTLYRGKHTLTAGISFEHQLVGNKFMPASNSYYIFNSLNDFITNQAPRYYAYTYSLVAGQKSIYAANLKLGQLGLYVQDEVNVSSKVKMTYGFRMDRPIYDEQPLSNPLVANLSFPDKNGKMVNYSTGMYPKSNWYVSPRVGFRYDVYGDKSLIIRGGTGVFTGRIPFVWLTNIPQNSSMYQNQVGVATNLQNFKFNPDPDFYASQFPNTAGTALPSEIVVTDPNFRFPQIWRTNLAVDRNLGKGWELSVEGMYTNDINAVVMRNANLTKPNTNANGADMRPRYTVSNRIYSNISSAIVLENSEDGGGFSFTAQISKKFSKGFYGSLAYSYNLALDLTANPGSRASSVWNGNATRGTQNDQELSFSQYAIPHRIVGVFSYRFEYFKKLATTISVFYEGSHQGRVTYSYNGDMNGDGNNRTDLMYIPRNSSEIVWDGNVSIGGVTFTPAQQWAILDQFISNSNYLNKRRGQYAERNGALMPFFHEVNIRVLQDVFTNIGKHKHTLQFSVDMLNFGNFINKKLGTRSQITTFQPLVFRNYNSSGVPTFRLNSVNNQPPIRPFQDNLSVFSTWGMQLGIRYIF